MLLLLDGCTVMANNNVSVKDLRCEYRVDPLGIDVTRPLLSWVVESSRRGQRQTAYRILVASDKKNLKQEKADLWDSGKVESDQSAHVVYKGKQLKSCMRCCWKLHIWDKDGKVCAWSEPAMWSMGLLQPSDWHAHWIGADWHGDWKQGKAPPLPWLRKTFVLEGKLKRATAYVSAMGYYELYINGKKVDDYVLSPAVCGYSKRALYITHDVTNYLVEGNNCAALWLGRGWYTRGIPGVIHDGPLAMAQIEAVMANGKIEIIGTDESWKVHRSPITPLGGVGHSKFGGERYEAQKELTNWNTVELNDSNWESAKIFKPKSITLTAQMVQPNRIYKTIGPVAIEELADGAYLVDMGRHFTGWFEICIRSGRAAGHKVTLEYVDQRRPQEGLITYNQTDEYITKGQAKETFCCRFDYHGFRWVKIAGLDNKPKLSDIKGYLISTDYSSAAEFKCSNELLNRIYQAVVRTYKCLSLGGYVVDCPHRERLGYGGDSHTSMETALSNFDMGAFFTKWLADWRDSQDTDSGDIPHISPPGPRYVGGGPSWGGICVALPWQLYLQYGDKRILDVSYRTIQKWLAFLDSNTKNNILEHYGDEIWGFLGDWVPPGRGQEPQERVDVHSTRFFNNCYYLYNIQLAAKIAAVLGKDTDASMYEKKAQTLKSTIHKHFFNKDNCTYANGEQPYLAFPLLIGLVPDELRSRVMENLENDILVRHKGHLNSGMHGTYFMFKYLMQQNRNDLIYEMVNKKTYPSWGYMLEHGATTIWEQWDGKHSQIHNTLLSVGSWFIQGPGGITVDESSPGFERFLIKPAIVGNLTWARCSYKSIHGKIVSDWHIENDTIDLNVTIPTNTTATVYIPANDAKSVREGSAPAAQAEAVRLLGMDNGWAVFAVDSGRYQFVSKLRR